jgi:hypothetical protein
MAVSGVCIRPAFRGNPGACLAIAVQAMKWGADPFAVANKAYVVKNRAGEETVAYEAQLIHAIVNASPVLQKRLRAVFEGQGQDRRCRIVGWVKGESETLDYQSPPIRAIAVKNSPLWQGDPDQQLFYYSTRAWARRHVPEILLGIYAQDEFQGDTVEHDPEPAPRREDYIQAGENESAPPGPEYPVVDVDGVENIYATPGAATEALRVMLDEAQRLGPATLDGLWESNAGVLQQIAAAGMDAEALTLTQAYESLKTRRPNPHPPSASEEPRPPGPPPPPRRHRAREAPPPADDTPEEEQAPSAAPEAPPDDHRMPPTEDPPPAERHGEPANPASHAAPRIAPPQRKDGQPDYRIWAVGLLMPKIRRCTTSAELAMLLGNNEDHLERARAEGGMAPAERGELNRLIDARFKDLPP